MIEEAQIYKKLVKLLEKSLDRDSVPVAALVTDNNGKIVTKARNKNPKKGVICHAEIIALNKTSRKKKTNRLMDFQLWVTMEPCMMCLGAIINTGIRKVNYFVENEKYGFLESNHTFDLSKMSIYKIKNNEYSESIKNIVRIFFNNLR